MAPPDLEEVPHFREVSVDRVQQPEVRDVGDAELGEVLVLLPPPVGQGAALGREQLHQAPGDRHQVLARRDVDERGDEVRVELVAAGRGPHDPRHGKRRVPLDGFALHQDPEVLARHDQRLFGEARVLIPSEQHLREVTRVPVLLAGGDVESVVALLGDGKIDVQRLLVRLPAGFEGSRGRRWIGVGDFEQQAIGQDTGGLRNPEHPARERLAIDVEALKPPRAKGEREELKLEQVFEKAILGLEVLGREQDALRPQNGLQLAHGQVT